MLNAVWVQIKQKEVKNLHPSTFYEMTFQEWYKNSSNMGNGGYEHVDKDSLGGKKIIGIMLKKKFSKAQMLCNR